MGVLDGHGDGRHRPRRRPRFIFYQFRQHGAGEFVGMGGDGTDEQPRNYGWILLRNDGNFQLRDVTAEYQLDDYGFAWGAILRT